MESRKPLLGSSQRVHYSPLKSKLSNSDYEEIPMISMGNNMSEIEDDISDDIMVRNKSSCNICQCCKRIWKSLTRCCSKNTQLKPRNIHIGHPSINQTFPVNKICNQKYNIVTFLPGVLYNQFKFFLNLYFLIMACSQFIPTLQIGYLYTYWAPLCFVLSVTVLREAVDEFRRYSRDKEINSTKYKILNPDSSTSLIESSKIKVSDILILEKDQRVPADIILLKTTEKNGTCFIRTDQLDGETDWKLRIAVSNTQSCAHLKDFFNYRAFVHAEKPQTDIHSFLGTYTNVNDQIEESLSIENAIWANTVVASGTAIGVVTYTGQHIRSVMNTSQPSTKIGITDKEINYLTKILFASVILLSFALVAIKGFDGPWYIYMFRFVILFSYIIPISLRVNLDMGKTVYSWLIQKDTIIPGTVVRSSTIPEELGRVNYLLSDKTGTLTQNEMSFKRLHIGTVAYSTDSMDELSSQLHLALKKQLDNSKQENESSSSSQKVVNPKVRSSTQFKVLEVVKAVAICHNVTPVYEDNGTDKVYQASSPDEIALVKWTESVGLTLFQRDLNQIELQSNYDQTMQYTILQMFPFSSESKRMGIIVRDEQDGKIIFYLKGADSVMSSIVIYNDWLNEECENMAREGLRTLVVAKKVLNELSYREFERQYSQAKLSLVDRARKVNSVVESLERDMELLCVTGVEDKLQTNVRPTLEMLSNAGIKVWMLTGDKLETAICIAKSSRLVSRDQEIHVFQQVKSRTETHLELNSFRRKAPDTVLIIDGSSLDTCLQYYAVEFVELACMCPSVVVCRCSPTQKAKIVTLLQKHTHKCICSIGDGGNDVSMIQAAHCGVGIVGKEGKQASLAADFSITQFCHLGPLLMVHGRNSYKRSASLSQFIIHRGLIISILQAVFSSVFYFSSVSLYQGFLMVGYTTVFTMFPVFSLVLDQDVRREVAIRFPELYHELHKGRSLSLKTFLIWVVVSIYQGGAIMYGGLLLFDGDFSHIVSISFTSLILTELLMVALTIHTWHWLMFFSEAISLAIYFVALVFFKEYFDPQFLTASDFVWKVIVITSITCVPLIILKYLRRKFSPTSYSKLDD